MSNPVTVRFTDLLNKTCMAGMSSTIVEMEDLLARIRRVSALADGDIEVGTWPRTQEHQWAPMAGYFDVSRFGTHPDRHNDDNEEGSEGINNEADAFALCKRIGANVITYPDGMRFVLVGAFEDSDTAMCPR